MGATSYIKKKSDYYVLNLVFMSNIFSLFYILIFDNVYTWFFFPCRVHPLKLRFLSVIIMWSTSTYLKDFDGYNRGSLPLDMILNFF